VLHFLVVVCNRKNKIAITELKHHEVVLVCRVIRFRNGDARFVSSVAYIRVMTFLRIKNDQKQKILVSANLGPQGQEGQINNAVCLLIGLDWSGRRLTWLDRKQRAQEHEQTLSEPNNTELQ
jgi:hypothetical protein